jgi:hypothetical protein
MSAPAGIDFWKTVPRDPGHLSLFPENRCEGLLADASIVGAKPSELRLRRPKLRQAAGRAEPHRLGF